MQAKLRLNLMEYFVFPLCFSIKVRNFAASK